MMSRSRLRLPTRGQVFGGNEINGLVVGVQELLTSAWAVQAAVLGLARGLEDAPG